MAKENQKPQPASSTLAARMMTQGWVSIALWMSVGLLLEGLIGYKIPAYLNDLQRRELFRLAHTHGTLLGLILVAASLCIRRYIASPMRPAQTALSLGSVVMPLGFLLAGIWHPEGDPGIAIWLVPPGALMVIFGAIALALACFKDASAKD